MTVFGHVSHFIEGAAELLVPGTASARAAKVMCRVNGVNSNVLIIYAILLCLDMFHL